jgi:glycosyltransferase involved in cell wall biosynthesis
LGYGPQETYLKTLANTLKITPHVHFLGPSSTPEIYYKHFSCLALPSTAEGFGLILVEAMAANTPVLAMNTPVIRSIVRNKIDGLLLDPPPTPEKLATGLASLLLQLSPPAPSDAPHFAPQQPHLPPSPAFPQEKSPLSSPDYAAAEFSLERMIQRHREFFQNF